MGFFKNKKSSDTASSKVQKPEKEKKIIDPEEKRAGRRRLANGSYALAVTAIIIAAIVVVNFIVAAIPTKFTTFDMTQQKLYSIGSTSKKVLKSLKSDVTLNFLTVSGQEDSTVEKLLDTYEGYSDHIKVKKVDMVSNPGFAKKYTDSDSSPSVNSVIVVSGDKNKVIDYNSLYEQSYSSDYSSQASAFDGEGQITSAISYVSSSETGTLYYTTGHKELSLSTEMSDTLSKSNIESKELNLLSSDIPNDCTALLVFSPQSDFTKDEVKKVQTYLNNGGHAMIVTLATAALGGSKTPNLDTIMSAYGITRTGGVVLESDSSKYSSSPLLTLPTVNSSSDVTSKLSNENVLDAIGEGLTIDEKDDSNYTVTSLLDSSDSSYIKTDMSNMKTVEKESGDKTGTYSLAVQVEQTIGGDSDSSSSGTSTSDTSSKSSAKEMKLLYFTSPALFSSDVLSSLFQVSVSLPEGNEDLFSNSVTYLTDRQVSVSVASKSLTTPQLKDGVISAGTASTIGNITMFLLPAVVLICGIVVWSRRRAR